MISYIYIKAQAVEKVGSNMFRLMIEEREVSSAERRLLEKLFPNLGDQVYDLLTREALISTMASPSEVQAAQEKQDIKEVYPDDDRAEEVEPEEDYQQYKKNKKYTK